MKLNKCYNSFILIILISFLVLIVPTNSFKFKSHKNHKFKPIGDKLNKDINFLPSQYLQTNLFANFPEIANIQNNLLKMFVKRIQKVVSLFHWSNNDVLKNEYVEALNKIGENINEDYDNKLVHNRNLLILTDILKRYCREDRYYF